MIAVIHFGGQYTQLIRRRVNELGVRADVISSAAFSGQRPGEVVGVILSGGPASVDNVAQALVREVMQWDVPILGICFGHQALVQCTGGVVKQQFSREYGKAELSVMARSPLMQDVPACSKAWVSHGDSISTLSDSWEVVGSTPTGRYAAIQHHWRPYYGVQFHPEVTHTEYGRHILRNFVLNICQAAQDFFSGDLIEEIVEKIRQHVGPDGHLMIACSLGVDSTVVAALCTRALGADRIHPIFVDNGLQREEDIQLARRAHSFLPNLQIIDASARFLTALAGQSDAEAKRRIVGTMFWETFTDVAIQLKERFPIVAYSQGTIAPDRIESGAESAQAAVIKTHHNLVKPPEDFPFVPFEPISTLYKDQVRAMGKELGVPEEILTKHPFPGPGLAVRVKGVVTPERVAVARQCDTIFIGELKRQGLYESIAQAGVVVLNDTRTCVKGDARASGWVVVLRAVVTEDFMTADVAPLSVPFLADIGDTITNQVDGVGGVTFDVTRKPPGTIEWE